MTNRAKRWRDRAGAPWTLLLCASLGASCSDTVGTSFRAECTPNDLEPCACSGASMGARTCGSDGSWSACACDDLDATDDAPVDAVVIDTLTRDIAPLDTPRADVLSIDVPPRLDARPDQGPDVACPTSCGSDRECLACAAPGDPGNYCCMSGLCIYTSGTCMSAPPDAEPDRVVVDEFGDEMMIPDVVTPE